MENSIGGNKREHARWRAIHKATHVQHVLASKIHSQAHAIHPPMRRGLMEAWLVLAEVEDDGEHNGGGRVKQNLAEKGRSNYKKFDPKSLTNPARDTVNERNNW